MSREPAVVSGALPTPTADVAVLRYRIVRFLLAALSGGLIALPWLNPAWYPLAWVAFVPLLFAMERRGPVEVYLLWMFAAFVWVAASTYWVAEFVVNLRGYPPPWHVVTAAAFWLYVAQMFGLIGLAFRWLRGRWLPDAILLPALVVTAFSLYPMLFQTRLAEAQTQFLLALQGMDLVGAYGLDFLIVGTSVLIYTLLRGRRGSRECWVLVGGIALVGAWMAYGLLRLDYWDEQIAGWDTMAVGLVQPNDAVSMTIPPPRAGYTRERPPEMAATQRLAAAGAQVVLWPEARYKGYFDELGVREAYRAQVRELGVDLIFHDLRRERVGGERRSFNAAAHLGPEGQLDGIYRKMRVMAFGEYLPAFWRLPGIRWFSYRHLGEFLNPIRRGERHEVFETAAGRILPKICYETSFPAFIAAGVREGGPGLVLVFLSQDGWFGATRAPFQHLSASIVRGVENRVPMVHLINGGPSAATAPSGRVVARTEPFTELEQIIALPHSPAAGGSFFSRYPWLLPSVLYSLLGGAVFLRLAPAVRKRSWRALFE